MATVDPTQQRVNQLEATLAELRCAHATLARVNKDDKSALRVAQELHVRDATLLEELRANLEAKEKKLAESSAAEVKCGQLSAQVAALEAAAAKAQKTAASHAREKRELLHKVSQMRDRLASLEEYKTKASTELAEVNKARFVVEKELAQEREVVNSQRQRAHAAENERDNIQKHAEALGSSIELLRRELQDARSRAEDAREEVVYVERRRFHAEAAQAAAAAKAQRVEEQAAQTEARLKGSALKQAAMSEQLNEEINAKNRISQKMKELGPVSETLAEAQFRYAAHA